MNRTIVLGLVALSGCVHRLEIPPPVLPPGAQIPAALPSSIDIPVSVDLRSISQQVDTLVPKGVDATDAWTFPYNAGLGGWCGNCKDHCVGGTEEECTNGCKDGCEQSKRDHNWRKKCKEAEDKREDDCNRNRGTSAEGHFCSHDGDGWKANDANASHWCSDNGDGRKGYEASIGDACNGLTWNGCLAACGGRRGCRDLWCKEDGANRKACYDEAGAGTANFGMKYRATRTPIAVSVSGNEIRASTTVDYSVEGCYRQKKPWPLDGDVCPTLASCGVHEAPSQVRATAAAALTWSPEWHLQSSTKFHLEYPRLCTLTIINYDVTDKVDGFLTRNLGKVADKIDEQVRTRSNLRPIAERAWTALSQPRSLAPDVWLAIRPSSIRVSPFSGSQLAIETTVGMDASPEIIAGQMPAPQTTPLPALVTAPPRRGLNVRLRGQLAYAFLTARLREQLKGKTLVESGHKLRIDDIRVTGQGGSAVVAIDIMVPEGFLKSTKGTLYLAGTPRFDAATSTLTIDDLDYSVQTRNVLVNAYDWIKHDALRSQFRAHAHWSAGDWLEKARAGLSKLLTSDLGHGVRLAGSVTSVRPTAIIATQNELAIYVDISGDASLQITP
jgi:hypothetical protein